MSACENDDGGTRVVDHALLDCEDLRAKPLLGWLSGMPQAAMLLDLDTGQTYRKVA